MNVQIPHNAGNILSSWRIISFSRTLLHGGIAFIGVTKHIIMQHASSKSTIFYFWHPTAACVWFIYDTLTAALIYYKISKYRTSCWYTDNYNYTAGKAQSPKPCVIIIRVRYSFFRNIGCLRVLSTFVCQLLLPASTRFFDNRSSLAVVRSSSLPASLRIPL
jgi:hypothetical protein